MSKFQIVFISFTRLIAACFAVLAIFCLPECRKLLNDNFVIEGETLYVPILSCSSNEPTSIVTSAGVTIHSTITSSTTTPENLNDILEDNSAPTSSSSNNDEEIDAVNDAASTIEELETTTTGVTNNEEGLVFENAVSDGGKSYEEEPVDTNTTDVDTGSDNINRKLEFNFGSSQRNNAACNDEKDLLFVNATMFSLFLSALGLVVFLLIDFLSKCRKNFCKASTCCKCLKPSLSIGMGLFLIFILVQTGFSTLSLVQECHWWQEVYQDFLDSSDASENLTEVQLHGNVLFLEMAAYSSFGISGLIFLDAIVQLIIGNSSKAANKADSDDETNFTTNVIPVMPHKEIPDVDHQLTAAESEEEVTSICKSATDTEIDDKPSTRVSTGNANTSSNRDLPPWAQVS